MFKVILQILLTLIAGYAFQQFLPFWSLTIAAAIIALLFQDRNNLQSFLAGFVAGGLLWYIAAFLISLDNLGILSGRMGELFGISGATVILVTGVMGGLLAGMGALCGTMTRRAIEK